MAFELPRVKYKRKSYIVDFRLGELRNPKTAEATKFTELKEDKYSPIKKKLRGIRARTWANEYIEGVDD